MPRKNKRDTAYVELDLTALKDTLRRPTGLPVAPAYKGRPRDKRKQAPRERDE